MLRSDPEEIIYTSGGTEADNTAIASATACLPTRKHVAVSTPEHPAVIQFFEMLEKEHGHAVSLMPVDGEGQPDLDQLDAMVKPGETSLVGVHSLCESLVQAWGNHFLLKSLVAMINARTF